MSRPPFARVFAILVLTVAVAGTALARDDASPVRIGWASWASNEITAKIVARVIEDRMGTPVELVNLDIAPMYRGLFAGDIDVVLAAWLPTAHVGYMDDVRSSVVNLGILYDHARMGWVVPAYIPESQVRSIGDLADPRVRKRMGGRIVGIEPGAGMTPISEAAIDAYGLDGYALRVSSGAGMSAALGAAIERREWIVVNGWTPHWMWGEWDLRYLEDPKGLFGGFERVHVLARAGFGLDRVDVAAALGRMWFPRGELQAALERAHATSFEAAAAEYIERHPERVTYWVSGEMPR